MTADSVDPIISYAQNFEDVMLWCALGRVRQGFYIDVGAAWPDQHSVTQAFYERGWHGINVEPNPGLHSLLSDARPRDVNLQVAVAASVGRMDLDVIPDTGLSTLDTGLGARYRDTGLGVETVEVEVTTLSRIISQFVPAQADIHFLKVDVEGFEHDVLRGSDWTQQRPWIVVVEATRPGTQEDNFEHWEPVLTDNDYEFVYADGVNRFYVALEHSELHNAFRFPPNVFDGFQLHTAVSAEERASSAEREAVIANASANRFQFELGKAEDRSDWLVSELSGATTHIRSLDEHVITLDEQLIASTAWGRQLSDRLGALQESLFERELRLGLLNSYMLGETQRFNVERQHWSDERGALRQISATLQHEREALGRQLAETVEGSDALRRQIDLIYQSTSWQASAPLRWVSGALRATVRGLRRLIRRVYRRIVVPLARPVAVRAMSVVLPRTRPNGRARRVLRRVPGVGPRLAHAAMVRGMLGPSSVVEPIDSNRLDAQRPVDSSSFETQRAVAELSRFCDQVE